MKTSWLFVIILLALVAVFSVQNAGVISVRFLVWETKLSAALVIQLAALLGALVGLGVGSWARRARRHRTPPAPDAPAGQATREPWSDEEETKR